MVFLFRRCSGLYLRNLPTTLWLLGVFHPANLSHSQGVAASIAPRHARPFKERPLILSVSIAARGLELPKPINVVLRIYACKRRVCATPHAKLALASSASDGFRPA